MLARTRARWRRINGAEQPEPIVRGLVLTEYLSWRRAWAARKVRVAGRPPADLTDAGDAGEVWARLATLGRRHRAVLVLRYYERQDDRAIADLIGCSPATVRTHASKALHILRLSSERQLIHAEEKS
ncbi:sigma factor-like helix-turn-helix DNA-binding protein [Micromonosporaceae bacterium Da 78-11]